jgi:hypothetical protein
MKDGYEMVVEELIVNPIYNPALNPWGKGASDSKVETEKSPRYKDKKKEDRSKSRSPSPNKSKSLKDDKKSNEGAPRPKCPGCGTWISIYHTTESCTWIKEKKKGYNPNWETESWEESDAGKKAKDQGMDFLPKIRKADPKKGTECEACLMTSSCDTCHLILNFLNHSSKHSNLPFIDSTIILQERKKETEKERRKEVKIPEARPFLDTGASGDFISNEFADLLIKENFKIEKLNSSCRVGLASHDNCLRAHNLIKFELIITDEF